MFVPHHFFQRWPLYLVGALILLLLTVTLIGERGVLHLWRLRGEKARLDTLNFRQQQTNDALRRRIMLIRNDNRYLEQLAREELNMVRPGEIVYRFSSSASRSGAGTPGR